MSEFLIKQRANLARIAVPLAALTLASGCTDAGSAQPRPPEFTITVPEIPTAPAVDSCAADNPTIAPFRVDEVINLDKSQLSGKRYGETLSDEDAAKYIADLDNEYGIKLMIPTTPTEDAAYNFGSIHEDPGNELAARDAAIVSVIRGVSLYPPDLIKALKLKELTYVRGITKKPEYKGSGLLSEVLGLYDPSDNSIRVDVEQFGKTGGLYGDTSAAVVHELSHAIDAQLLCGTDQYYSDSEITKLNTQFYKGYEDKPTPLPLKFTHPSAVREFANEYGASALAEDRATIVEWTFTQRGLIQEGDPDWDSPLAEKQRILVGRLEELIPGITDYLKLLTAKLRNDYRFELAASVETSYFPDRFMSFTDMLEIAHNENVPVEMLTNGVLEFTTYSGVKNFIVNPLLMRNTNGEIIGFVWAHDGQLNSEFYDPTKMNLRYNGDSLQTIKDKMEVEVPAGRNFFNLSSLTIDGQASDVFYDDDGSAKLAADEAQYPNIYVQVKKPADKGQPSLSIPTTTNPNAQAN